MKFKTGRIISFLIFFILIVFQLTAAEELSKNLELDTKFFWQTDQDTVTFDYYDLGIDLDFRLDLPRGWKIGLDLEVNQNEVLAEEIWTRYKNDRFKLKLGMFENDFLADSLIPSKQNPFVTENLIVQRIEDMGWISSSATGIRLSRQNSFAHLLFQPSGREVQLNGGWYYPYRGEDSYLGISGAYYNYMIHSNWIGDNSYTQDHNFLFNTVLANLTGNLPIIFKGDLTLGQNLIDPIGYLHFTGDGEVSWFAGADLMVAYPVNKEDFQWLPGFNASLLLADLDYMEAWTAEFRTGHMFSWDDTFFLRMEGGLTFLTHYNTDNTLITELEEIWAISFEIRL